ncbi:MAG: hypothetical protein ACLS4A_12710 [Oscillospiraceae bacterium]
MFKSGLTLLSPKCKPLSRAKAAAEAAAKEAQDKLVAAQKAEKDIQPGCDVH